MDMALQLDLAYRRMEWLAEMLVDAECNGVSTADYWLLLAEEAVPE